MTLDHALDNGQAQPFARCGLWMQPLEGLKYLRPAGLADALSIVLDEVSMLPGRWFARSKLRIANLDAPRTRGVEVVQGVADEVGEDLLQGGRIAGRGRQVVDLNGCARSCVVIFRDSTMRVTMACTSTRCRW